MNPDTHYFPPHSCPATYPPDPNRRPPASRHPTKVPDWEPKPAAQAPWCRHGHASAGAVATTTTPNDGKRQLWFVACSLRCLAVRFLRDLRRGSAAIALLVRIGRSLSGLGARLLSIRDQVHWQ